MTTGTTSYVFESFVEDLLRMSVPQNKEQTRCSASIERSVLVYIRSV